MLISDYGDSKYSMSSSNKTIVWFRRDLRIEDNPALAAAARDGAIFPVYIWCPKDEGQFYPGRVSRWWLKQSLDHLNQSLKSLGAPLALIKTDSTISALVECIKATGATKVVFNHLYDPVSLVRDHYIKGKLLEQGISVQSYNADLLREPWEVYDTEGQTFTTFNEYWVKCLNLERELVTFLPPWKLLQATGKVSDCSIEELGLENETEKSSNALLGRAWIPGWSQADKISAEFFDIHLLDYAKNRTKLGGNSTSLLSPYLHFGEVSVRKIFQVARIKQMQFAKEGNSLSVESVTLFLRAIGLREFSRYICFNFPMTHEKLLVSNLRFFPWEADQGRFKAWRQGRTGYPLVDAGMRELWATGWIHNRIRVIVSSFAVKVLLLPWRWGMKYFWDTLIDADLENDILGWQYITGSLPDGPELERLDSPEVQGSKFDPDGEYVRRWLPELVRLPTQWIHHPWDTPANVLRVSGVELGVNYPRPIIEIDSARECLTEAIFKMWELEAAAKAASQNGTNEVVVNNTCDNENLPVPKVILRNNTPCVTYSSNDQKVPSCHNSAGKQFKKRSRYTHDCQPLPDNGRDTNPNEATSRRIEGIGSAAESSMSKKQTSSTSSFSVPHSCSSSSYNPFLEYESCETKQSWQDQIDMGQNSSKNGGTEDECL